MPIKREDNSCQKVEVLTGAQVPSELFLKDSVPILSVPSIYT